MCDPPWRPVLIGGVWAVDVEGDGVGAGGGEIGISSSVKAILRMLWGLIFKWFNIC